MTFGHEFWNKPTTYILCWPGDDRVTVQWAGDPILLPSRNEVAHATDAEGKPIKGSRFRFNSVMDADGKPLPGTLALADVVTVDPMSGARVKAFDAQGVVNGLWGNLPLRKRGLRIVTDPKDVAGALAEGRPEWEKQRIAAAEQTIRDEITRRKMDEAAGVPARESSDAAAVKEAHEFLQTVRREQKESIPTNDLMASLTGVPAGVQAAPTPKPVVPELSDATVLAQALFERATEAGLKLTKAELEGLLRGNVDVLDQLSRRLDEETTPVAKGA